LIHYLLVYCWNSTWFYKLQNEIEYWLLDLFWIDYFNKASINAKYALQIRLRSIFYCLSVLAFLPGYALLTNCHFLWRVGFGFKVTRVAYSNLAVPVKCCHRLFFLWKMSIQLHQYPKKPSSYVYWLVIWFLRHKLHWILVGIPL